MKYAFPVLLKQNWSRTGTTPPGFFFTLHTRLHSVSDSKADPRSVLHCRLVMYGMVQAEMKFGSHSVGHSIRLMFHSNLTP